jgi:hypothetical protein
MLKKCALKSGCCLFYGRQIAAQCDCAIERQLALPWSVD